MENSGFFKDMTLPREDSEDLHTILYPLALENIFYKVIFADTLIIKYWKLLGGK